ncbi:MAG: PaaI family thioesterase [Acidobacteria bacterium]|nr:PaaI family thioesterase [Acidobacteriota bacterium]
MLEMTVAEIQSFLSEHFPKIDQMRLQIESLAPRELRLRMGYHEAQLRPGGTLSGPTQMALADVGVYILLLAHIGPVALAVTTNLNINFLRKPAPADLIAQINLLKLGQRLAIGEVTMFSEGEDEPVAHATVTYSIPPAR